MLFENSTCNSTSLNDMPISYAIGGSGPPVLMLHGFPQTKAMWSPVAGALQSRYTVVCADLRGYGDSGAPPGDETERYSFRAMAADPLALMERLGFDRFHLVGHDRGGRTAHRLALDAPERVRSLALLDIVPTDVMLERVTRDVAYTYWHWYFLSQPAPLPQSMVQHDPDFFYETCLETWGATRLSAFDPELLDEYGRCWREPKMTLACCADYRATIEIDHRLDHEDRHRKLACPTLAFWGSVGAMARLFDMEAQWRAKCERLETATLPGGHFFVDQFPRETAEILTAWLDRQA